MIKTNKVLYVGYYKEYSDWGKFAVNNIKALMSADVDVACRSITFQDNRTPRDIFNVEKNQIDDCDICIQHLFPNHMLASSNFKKNIGILANEFVTIDHSCWVEKLNAMDQIWVSSPSAKEVLDKTVLRDKTVVVPFAFDTDVYKKQHPALKGGIESEGKFRFYTISNLDNPEIERVIRCFHSEFDHADDAVLVVQINGENTNGLDDRISKVKTNLGLQKDPTFYKKDIIVTKDELAQSSDNSHAFCDCYVSSLSQRSLFSEEFHAMAFGNTPIVLQNTDAEYYTGPKYSVSTVYQTNAVRSELWPDINNGKNYIVKPCEKQTKAIMRELYNEWKENPATYKVNKKKEAFDRSEAFSIKNVGKIMKEILYA